MYQIATGAVADYQLFMQTWRWSNQAKVSLIGLDQPGLWSSTSTALSVGALLLENYSNVLNFSYSDRQVSPADWSSGIIYKIIQTNISIFYLRETFLARYVNGPGCRGRNVSSVAYCQVTRHDGGAQSSVRQAPRVRIKSVLHRRVPSVYETTPPTEELGSRSSSSCNMHLSLRLARSASNAK
jgi:hypothetical protein